MFSRRDCDHKNDPEDWKETKTESKLTMKTEKKPITVKKKSRHLMASKNMRNIILKVSVTKDRREKIVVKYKRRSELTQLPEILLYYSLLAMKAK